jgi:catechol 2,3-dioxygenase-like lactoylglutathione lyase family enzyme
MDLNQVTVPTSDMERAIAFYQKLGLELIVHTHPGYARFVMPNGKASFSLQFKEAYKAAKEGIHIYFEVSDIVGTYESLSAKGVLFLSPPEMKTWLWHEAHLLDPDGNHLIIYHAGENRLNPPWRISN